MKVYETKQIRNLALFGHAGSGKTTLAEAILLESGAINRRGSVDEKNTASDYHELEQERGCSLFQIPMFAEYKGCKINFIDTPGYNDYIGEISAAATVADAGVILLNAQNGVEVGSENGWLYSSNNNIPVVFAINKLDVDQADFDESVNQLKDLYGSSVTVIQFPVQTGSGFNQIIDILKMKMYQYSDGKEEILDIPDSEKDKVESMRNELVESIAETDEDLMNKYFDEGELSAEEINTGLKKALNDRQFFPVFCLKSKDSIGVARLMEFVTEVCPAPNELPAQKTVDDKEVACDPSGKVTAFVYKLTSEAQAGDVTYFKVMSGTFKNGIDLYNEQKSTSERFNQLFIVNGKKRVEVDTLSAGDLGATVKLKSTAVSHTLHEKGDDVEFPKIAYPNPIVRMAVVPETKGEEEKVGTGLHAVASEDPSLTVEHSQELRQLILHGQGELHLGVAKWRLENRYKVKAEYIEPRVPYRETIQKQVKGSYRHKKQSGGAGQFAEVHMLIEPWYEDAPYPAGMPVRGKDLHELDWGGKLEYVNGIVGGVIDQRFLPAILKGVMDKMQIGPLTGSYVRDIRVFIYDGKMHPVDSNEAAFKTAGMMVFKDNFVQAAPKILEPIYNVKIRVPEEFVGDIMSDLPTRRGLIQGIDTEGRYQVINAQMPLAELDKYATSLRSMSAGRATYTQEYAEYQTVPANVQQELMAAYKKSQEED